MYLSWKTKGVKWFSRYGSHDEYLLLPVGRQKKYTVASIIGKLVISFLALSSKHPSTLNYPVQLNLQQNETFLR